jgi:hypothetical protein
MNNETNRNLTAFYSPEVLARLAKSSRKDLERAAELGLIKYTVLPRGNCQFVKLEEGK